MTEPSHDADPQQLRTMSVIWLALMAGVAIYTIVTYVLVEVMDVRVQGDASAVSGMLTWAASAAALVLGAGLLVARRAEEQVDRSLPPQRRVARYFTTKLMGLAIEEGAGFLVITLSLIAADGIWAAAAGVATLGVMWISGPRREHVDRLLQG